MISVLISSTGAAWTFFAAAGDKIFLAETKSPAGENRDLALAHMIRECRWMFGDRRVIYFDRNDDWVEVLHNGAGDVVGTEPYDGPVPEQEDDDHE